MSSKDDAITAQVKAQCLELSHRFVQNIPEWQHQANAEFFYGIWQKLAMGGVYGWPSTNRVFKKIPTGWVEITP